MYDWIIEADAHRLMKAANEASSSSERRSLEAVAERKLALLSLGRRNAELEAISNA